MKLKIAYIASEGLPDRTINKRLSAKEKLHRAAVEGLAEQRIIDRKAAEKKYAAEAEELRLMKEELAMLQAELN